MKKLLEQIAKFGIVGVIAFIIDAGLLNIFVSFLKMNAVVAATFSFLISLTFNYVASMKYVFVRREDMARWMEITVFFISSAIGLLINDAIIWVFTNILIDSSVSDTDHAKYIFFTNTGKITATVVVAVWNFVIRKWLLEAPNKTKPGYEKTLSHRLGLWSLQTGKRK